MRVSRFVRLGLWSVIFTVLCVAIQGAVGGYATDRGLTNDEAAHLVNAMLVLDYLREAPFTNPWHFAQAYYLHFPRVSIGHWPPLFYGVQAAFFALFGRSAAVAMALQAVIGGLAAGASATLVQYRLGWAAGLAAGVLVLASPALLFLLDAVMLDTFLALWVFGAAMCWAWFARRPGGGAATCFAVCAIGAIMTKGNGFALALLPPLHALWTRDARPLLDRRAWFAAIAVAVATLPWYVLTYRMAAGGFNYAWGWDYTGRALPAYLGAVLPTLGAIGVAGFCIGAVRAAWPRPGVPDHLLVALSCTTVAMLLFQAIVPADITPRYLVAFVPAAVVVVADGLAVALRRLVPGRGGAASFGTMVALLLLANAAMIVRLPHVAPFGMDAVARRILDSPDANGLVLVAGSARAEGALIAAFAVRDPACTHYVLRASQMLATSNFMGSRYAARFDDAGAVARWLGSSGIGWLVLDESPDAAKWLHDRQLAAVAGSASGWRLVDQHPTADGTLRLYRLPAETPTPEQRRALLAAVTPSH